MAIAHVLTDIDSLQSLAVHYLGDASSWQAIADYNRLEYPYLLKDKSALKDLYSKGYITIVRANFNADLVIRKGWTFKTKPSIFTGGMVKTYEVVQDTLIPAGVSTGFVPLRATAPGSFGNAMEYMITEPGEELLANNVQLLSIYNEANFTGGTDLRVKVTGDTIYIPTDATDTAPEDVGKMLEMIGGEDLVLDAEGELVFQAGGDLASVSGVDNIKQAVIARLTTEVGELLAHPTYGTEIPDLIGMATPYNLNKLAEINVIRALNEEDRITNPTVNKIAVEGSSAFLDVSYDVAVTDTKQNLKLTL